jgi:hypothetical protein
MLSGVKGLGEATMNSSTGSESCRTASVGCEKGFPLVKGVGTASVPGGCLCDCQDGTLRPGHPPGPDGRLPLPWGDSPSLPECKARDFVLDNLSFQAYQYWGLKRHYPRPFGKPCVVTIPPLLRVTSHLMG